MSLSSLPSALLIPPLNLITTGVVGLVVTLHFRRVGYWITALSVLGLYVLSVPATASLLIGALEAGQPRDFPSHAASVIAAPQAIIILSGDAAYGDEGGIEPWSDIGPLTLDRMRAGMKLQRATGLPVLVSGGALESDADPIATQMARSLSQDFATPVRWIEATSNDTWENARNSAALLGKSGITSAYVVTHAWHMRRALLAFAHTSIAVTAAPIRFNRWPILTSNEFIPRPSAWIGSYYAIHEWIGCAYYALRP